MAPFEGVTLSPSLAAGIEITDRKIDPVSCERHRTNSGAIDVNENDSFQLYLCPQPSPARTKLHRENTVDVVKLTPMRISGGVHGHRVFARLPTPSLAVDAKPIFYCVTSI